jgi:putative flippase GtrA
MIIKLAKSVLTMEFIRYVIVGVASVIIEMSALVLLVEQFNIPYLESNTLAFLFTAIVNYVLSRLWVFEKTGRRKRIEFLWFALFLVLSLLISQLLMWYGVERLHIDYKISKLISIVIVVAWNFLTRKHFIFGKHHKAQA